MRQFKSPVGRRRRHGGACKQAVLSAITMLFVLIFAAVSNQSRLHHGYVAGLRIRTLCILAVYRKSLELKSSDLKVPYICSGVSLTRTVHTGPYNRRDREFNEQCASLPPSQRVAASILDKTSCVNSNHRLRKTHFVACLW